MAAVLVIAACIARCPRTSVRAEGLVLSIAADRHALVIRRDDIVGATRGVPLSFTLDDPARLGDLAQGTAVRFVYSESFARLGRRLDEITAIDTALPMHDHRAQHDGIVAMIDRLHVEATATRDGRIRL